MCNYEANEVYLPHITLLCLIYLGLGVEHNVKVKVVGLLSALIVKGEMCTVYGKSFEVIYVCC